MNKKAKNKDIAWDIQDRKKDESHCWIQWKGTDVCMDFRCTCGHSGHIDDDFVYFIECPECGKVYMCNGHIELIELEERPDCDNVIKKGDK